MVNNDIKREVKQEVMDPLSEATSPLGPLDPGRLRDMVVDQQNMQQFHQPAHHQQQMQQGQGPSAQQGWTPQPHESPQHARPHNLQGMPMDQMQMPQQSQMQHGQQQPGTPQQQMGPPNTPGAQQGQMQQGGFENQQQQPGYSQQHMVQYPGQPPVMPPQSPGGMQMQQGAGGPMPSPGGPQSAMYQQRMMQMQGQPGGPMMPHQGGYPGYAQNGQWAGQQMGPQGGFVQGRVMQGPGQMGQRVAMQRVPYPNPGGFPGGPMQQPGAAGYTAVQRPQQMPRPAQYPHGAGPPAGYVYAGQPQPYQQGMAFQRPNQAAQPPMRPYMNSPQAMMNPNVYPPGGQQPTTPQTPQPQFTPNGSRFPGPTQSPHAFAGPPGPDLRSPPLMSPGQPMARTMSSGDLPGPPMQIAPPQYQYYGHNPQFLHNVTPEMCLIGCVIHVLEVDRYTTDKADMQNIANTIKLFGGDIDFGLKSFQERLPQITHVIFESSRPHPVIQQALKAQKRVVTMQWLHDTVTKRRMEAPWRASHIPGPFSDAVRPHAGRLVSFSGFDADERISLKFMVETIGGRCTPYLSKHNNLLIAKSDGCEKVERAKEWNIPIVNYQWLFDAYFGRPVPVELRQYQVGHPCMDVKTTPYQLEMVNDMTKRLLAAWTIPIVWTVEGWNRALEVKRMLEADVKVFPNTKYKLLGKIEQLSTALQNKAVESGSCASDVSSKNFGEVPTESDIATAENLRAKLERETGEKTFRMRVAFAGFDAEVQVQLALKARFLGALVIEDPTKCTHLVTLNGRRTLPLLLAIAGGAFVVRPEWVISSYDQSFWQDSIDYFVKDEEAERHLGYSLKHSVLMARRGRLFEDCTFYITPSVEPPRDALARLIEVSGGKVLSDRPDPEVVVKCVETETPLIIIGAECDLRSVQYLIECHIPIYLPEMVLMSVLRQEVITIPAVRINLLNVFPPPRTAQPPGQPGAAPAPTFIQRAGMPPPQQMAGPARSMPMGAPPVRG